jgi:hypothetical protein
MMKESAEKDVREEDRPAAKAESSSSEKESNSGGLD